MHPENWGSQIHTYIRYDLLMSFLPTSRNLLNSYQPPSPGIVYTYIACLEGIYIHPYIRGCILECSNFHHSANCGFLFLEHVAFEMLASVSQQVI